MDRGGTITWYLTANDADFLSTLRRARAEARAAGVDIDRHLNTGSKNASAGLSQLRDSSDSLSGSLRGVKRDVVDLGSSTGGLNSSLSGLVRSTNTFNSSLGGAALRGFNTQLGGTNTNATRAGRGISGMGLSLKDFYGSLSRSANAFRSFQIALRGFQMTSLIVGATLAVGAIIELTSALAALAGLLYTIPAGVSAFAGAMATIKIATGGIGDSFKKLTKATGGVSAAQGLAKRQNDIMRSAMKQDEALTRRLTDLKEDYSDVLQELAEERMRVLNEQIMEGVDAWREIADAASDYLDISKSLADQTQDIQAAQLALTSAIFNYGAGSQQAVVATRDLYAAQAKLAASTAKMDAEYATITDSVKDLATNLGSLQKANRNEIKSTLLSLQTLKLDKQVRGESTEEIQRMVDLLQGLAEIKDTKLGVDADLGGAQAALDGLKGMYPEIAIAAEDAASSTEQSLNKSLQNITESMEDVRRERSELAAEMKESLAEAAADASAKAAGEDPFAGLSKNARAFVIALKEVYDAFQPVKNVIQDNFFAGLDTEIRNVAAVTFPILQEGLGNIATAMNGVIKEASRVVQQPFFTGAMEASMATTTGAVNILKGAVEPLARVFTDLVNIGNPYVLMLSEWIVKQAELAAAFTGSEDGQNKINEAIKLGIDAMKSIGSLIGEVAGLFYDLFKLSNDAGVSFIDTLTQIISNMRDYIGTEEGGNRMKALFEASQTVFEALADVIGGFVKGILGLIEAYNNLDGPVKSFVTNLLVFSAVAAPVLSYLSSIAASGLLVTSAFKEVAQAADFLSGGKLLSGVKALTSSTGGLGKAFSLLSKNPLLLVIGLLVAAFVYLGTQTTVFQDAFKQLQPVFEQLGTAMQPVFEAFGQLAEVLGGAIAQIVPVLAEIFGQLLAALLPLVAPILQLVMTLLPVLVQIIQMLVAAIQFLMPIIVVVAQIIGAVLVAAVQLVVGIFKAVIAIVQVVANVFVAAWMGIAAAWQGVPGFFQGLWDGIVTVFSVVGTFFINLFRGAWEGIKNIWNAVTGFFSSIGNGIANIFNNAVNGIRNAFNGAVNFVRGIPGNIMGALGNLGSMLWNAGGDMIRGLINGIASNSYAVVNKIREIAAGALNAIKSFFGIRSPSRVMAQMGGYVMGGFEKGINDMTSPVVNAAQSAAGAVLDTFSGMATDIGTMTSDFAVTGASTLTSQFAPAAFDSPDAVSAAGSGVTINQTNQVYTELDMGQVNRNLTWEMNKV